MTKEEKDLLLKDLCARLPFGLKCINVNWPKDGYVEVSNIWTREQKVQIFEDWVNIEYCKPYLRPMSDMTDEEKYTYRHMLGATLNSEGVSIMFVYEEDFSMVIDWLNEHMFDYRGLIEKGLALEAPEDMYKFE